MSDKESTGELVEMVGGHVVNTAHDGYRRAGFVLQKGENILSTVPASVLKALEADPRLAVMVIATDIDSDTSGRLGDQVISTTVVLDDAPPPAPEIIVPEEVPAPVIDESQPSVTDDLNPVEAITPAPDTETAQPETPKKGKGKK